jgi:phosphoribosyl 1,2-cyclic phosphodiesterase
MQVRFWGTRGSLSASVNAEDIRQKVRCALEIAAAKGLSSNSDVNAFIDKELPFSISGTYGTNTSCVEIRDGDDFVLCDAGSGLRDFGNHVFQQYGKVSPADFHIFISHLHWDHIQGFPFFMPIYAEGNHITVYGCHNDIADAFRAQHTPPFFPVDFKDLGAEIQFVVLAPDKTYEIARFKVTAKEQNHPGKSYGYRFEKDGKIIVYSTDSEHKCESDEDSAPFVEFFSRADLLIFDAQYTFDEGCTIKEDWGHSNNLIAVELAQKAGVKHLCLYHQEPTSSDEDLDNFLQDTRRLASQTKEGSPLRISLAWDGMVIEV